jgi:hypothetical protein
MLPPMRFVDPSCTSRLGNGFNSPEYCRRTFGHLPIIVEDALHHRCQLLPCPRHGLVPTLAQLLRPRLQLGHQPLANGLAPDAAVARLPVPLADVRAAQQVAGRWLAFSPLLPVGDGG